MEEWGAQNTICEPIWVIKIEVKKKKYTTHVIIFHKYIKPKYLSFQKNKCENVIL